MSKKPQYPTCYPTRLTDYELIEVPCPKSTEEINQDTATVTYVKETELRTINNMALGETAKRQGVSHRLDIFDSENGNYPQQASEDHPCLPDIPATVEAESASLTDNQINDAIDSPKQKSPQKKLHEDDVPAKDRDVQSIYTKIIWQFKDASWKGLVLALLIAILSVLVPIAYWSYGCYTSKTIAVSQVPNQGNETKVLNLAYKYIEKQEEEIDKCRKEASEMANMTCKTEAGQVANQSICFDLSLPGAQFVFCDKLRCEKIFPVRENGIEAGVTSTEWYPLECSRQLIVPFLPSCMTTKGASAWLEIEEDPDCPGRLRVRCSCSGKNPSEGNTVSRDCRMTNFEVCPKRD